MVVPPLYVRWWRCPLPDAWRGRREGLGVRALSWCANTRAHGERKRGGRGGASWGGQWWPGWGLWVVARWVVTRIGGDKYPKPGESEIDTTGAGAGCAPGRGGVLAVGARGGGGSWWGRSFLWVRGVGLGVWRFPLGGGLGLVVTISPW